MHAARYIRLGMRGDGPLCVRECTSSTLLPPLRPPLIPSPATQNNNEQRQNSSMHPSVFSADALACLHRVQRPPHSHTHSLVQSRASLHSLLTQALRAGLRAALTLSPRLLHITSHLLHTLLRTGTSARRSAALYSDAAKPVEALDPHAPSGLCAAVAPCLYEKIEVPAPAGTVDMISSEMSTLVNSL